MSTSNKQAADLYKPSMQSDADWHDRQWIDERYYGSGFLGTWSKADEANFNTQMSDVEWLRNLQLMDYQNWYNSPEQQAIRMRQAGLNPDLQGINSQPSASASAPKTAAPSGTNPIDTGIQIAGAFLQTVSVAHKLAEGVTKVVGSSIANQASRADSIFSGLGAFLQNIAPAGVPVLDGNGDLVESTHQLLDSASLKAFESRFPRGKSRRMAREFLQAFQDSNYHKELWYGLRGTTEEKRRNLLKWLGSSQYSSLDTVVMEGLGKVYEVVHDSNIATGKAQIAKGKYDESFFTEADPISSAKKQNWVNHRASNFETIRTESINAFNKVIAPMERNRPTLYNIVSAIAPVLIDYFLGLSFAGYND